MAMRWQARAEGAQKRRRDVHAIGEVACARANIRKDPGVAYIGKCLCPGTASYTHLRAHETSAHL
eukprot:13711113-Alexandrium_andersonii.AAC.1